MMDISHKTNPKAILRTSCGFTFIEIIVSLVLLSILTAIFGMGLVAAMNSYAFSRTNADTVQKGQLAMQRMGRELAEVVTIHTIGSDFIFYDRIENDENGIPFLETKGFCYDENADQIVFYSDLSGTLTCPPAMGTGHMLINGIAGFSLVEHIQNNQTFAITVTMDLSRPDAPTIPQTFTQLVHIRNNGNEGGAV